MHCIALYMQDIYYIIYLYNISVVYIIHTIILNIINNYINYNICIILKF